MRRLRSCWIRIDPSVFRLSCRQSPKDSTKCQSRFKCESACDRHTSGAPAGMHPVLIRHASGVNKGRSSVLAVCIVVQKVDHYAHFTPKNVDSGPAFGPLCTLRDASDLYFRRSPAGSRCFHPSGMESGTALLRGFGKETFSGGRRRRYPPSSNPLSVLS